MRKLRMYKSALFLVSWFPKGLGLDVPTTNSKGLTLRPGMQEEHVLERREQMTLGGCSRRSGIYYTPRGDLSVLSE